jgi:TP901 family phage tail tape measure protein
MSVNIRFNADVMPAQRGIQAIDRQMDGLLRSAEKVSEATRRIDLGPATKVNTTSAVSNVDRLTTSVHRLERQSTMTGNLIRNAFIGIAAAFSGGMVINTIAGFGDSMARVGAITNATADDMVKLTKRAREVGAATEFTSSQAAKGLGFLGMAGFNADESMAAIDGLVDLATAADMQLDRVADIASNIAQPFKIPAEEITRVTSVLAEASRSANTNVEQLGVAMAYAAPNANALGLSIGDTAAMVGVLSNAGIQASMAGTSLRGMFTRLVSPPKDAREAIEGLGLSVDAVKKMAGDGQIAELLGMFGDMGVDAETAYKIFGQRGMAGSLELMAASAKEGGQSLQELMKKFNEAESKDIAGEMARRIRDTLSGDLKTLSASLEDLMLTMAAAGGETALRAVVSTMTSFVRAIARTIDYIATFVQAVYTVGVAFKSVITDNILASDTFLVLSTMFEILKESIQSITNNLSGFNPFAKLTSFLNSFVLSLNISAHFSAAFDSVISIVVNFVNKVIGWFQYLGTVLVWNSLVPDMVNSILGWFGKLSDGVEKLWTTFQWFITVAKTRFNIGFMFGYNANEVLQTMGLIGSAMLILRSRLFLLLGGFSVFFQVGALLRGKINPILFAFNTLKMLLLSFTFVPEAAGFLSGVVSDKVVTKLREIGATIRAVFVSIKDYVASNLSAVVSTVSGFVKSVIDWFWHLGTVLIWNSLVKTMLADIATAFGNLASMVLPHLKQFGSATIEFFRSLGTKLTEAMTYAVENFAIIGAGVTAAGLLFEGFRQGAQNVGDWFTTVFRYDANTVMALGTLIASLFVSATMRGLALKAGLIGGFLGVLLPSAESGYLQRALYGYVSGFVGLILEIMGKEFTSPGFQRMTDEVWSKILTPPDPNASGIKRYFDSVGNTLRVLGSTIVVSLTDNLFNFTDSTSEKLGQKLGGTIGGAIAVGIAALFSSQLRSGIVKVLSAGRWKLGLAGLVGAGIGDLLTDSMNLDDATSTVVQWATGLGAMAGAAYLSSFMKADQKKNKVSTSSNTRGPRVGAGSVNTSIFNSLLKPLSAAWTFLLQRVFGTVKIGPIIALSLAGVGISAAILSALSKETNSVGDVFRSWLTGIISVVATMNLLSWALGKIVSSSIIPASATNSLAAGIAFAVGNAFGKSVKFIKANALPAFNVFSAASLINWLVGDLLDFGPKLTDKLLAGIVAGGAIGKMTIGVRNGILVGVAAGILQAWNSGALQDALNSFGQMFDENSNFGNHMKSVFDKFKSESGWLTQLIGSSFETAMIAAWGLIKWRSVFGAMFAFDNAGLIESIAKETFGVDFYGAIEDAIKVGTTVGIGAGMIGGPLVGIGYGLAAGLVAGFVSYLSSAEAVAAMKQGFQNLVQSMYDSAFGKTDVEKLDARIEEAKASFTGLFAHATAASQNVIHLDSFFDEMNKELSALSTEIARLERMVIELPLDVNREPYEQAITQLTAEFDNTSRLISEMLSSNVKKGVLDGVAAIPAQSIGTELGSDIGSAAGAEIRNQLNGAVNTWRMQSGNLTGGQSFPVGTAVKRANGGYISGPGGPRSDVIPAMLSNGEFVVNAAATRRYSSVLESINSGNFKGFADGGYVSDGPSSYNGNNQLISAVLSGLAGTQIDLQNPVINDLVKTLSNESVAMLTDRTALRNFVTGYTTGLNLEEARSLFDSLNLSPSWTSLLDFPNESADVIPYIRRLVLGADALLGYKGNQIGLRASQLISGFESSKFKNMGPDSQERLISKIVKDFVSGMAEGGFYGSVGGSGAGLIAAAKGLLSPRQWVIRGGPKGIIASNIAIGAAKGAFVGGVSLAIERALSSMFDSGIVAEGYANGGYISGPGGPRSDVIPAMLSNGEFVVNAAATRRYGSLLEAINSGSFKGFADGGYASGFQPRSSVGSDVILSANNVTLDMGQNRPLSESIVSSLASGLQNIANAGGVGQYSANQIAIAVRGTGEIYHLGEAIKATGAAATKAAAIDQTRTAGTQALSGATSVLTEAQSKAKEASEAAAQAAEDFANRVSDAFANRNSNEFGLNAAVDMKNSFENGLRSALVEGGGLKAFGKTLLDSFTNSVIQAFSEGFTDMLFGDNGLGLGRIFKDFFGSLHSSFQTTATEAVSGETGILQSAGGIFKGLFGGIGNLFKSLFSVFGFANGGPVYGPGGPRSDVIPAMLSNGEYVINAQSTARFRPLLDAINSGQIPKGFAAGGMVDSASVTALATARQATASDSVEVNNYITGDISRQTKQEIRKMIPEIAGQLSAYRRDRNK